MVRQPTRLVFLIGILVNVLAALPVNASCPCVNNVQARLDEIERQDSRQHIRLLTDLEKQFQRCGCTDSSYALLLHNLGRAYYREGRDEMALKEFERSLSINRQFKLKANTSATIYKAIGSASFYLSYLHYEKGDYQVALESAEQGIYYARLSSNNLLESQSLGEKARDLMMLGKSQEALGIIDQALQRVRNDSSSKALQSRIICILLKAQIARRLGKPELSVSLYHEAINYYLDKHQVEKAAYAYGNLGYLYMETFRDYKKAIRYFELAYSSFTDPYEKARVLNNIGENYTYAGQWDKALNSYQKAFQTLPINFHQTNIYRNPSVEAMGLVVDKSCLLTLIRDKAYAWLSYAKSSGNKQYLHAALDTYQVADHMIDVLRWEHTGHQSKLFWRQKTRGMYEHAIETCYRLGDTEQAFRFMEKSRAVMLADKLNELGAKRQLSHNQAADEKRLRKRVSERQTEIAALTPDSNRYEPARMALNASQDSLNSFLKELEESNPAYYRYKYDNATPSVADLQTYLTKQGSSLVTYFVGDSALYLMAISSGKSVLKKQPIGPYTQTLQQFAPLLATAEAMRKNADVSRYLALSNSLYQQLLAPLDLQKGRVVVSPDGFFIPFDALSRSASQPHYLVADYAFSYVYSARLLLKNQTPDRQVTGFRTYDFLGIAPVDFAPSLGQVMLPNSDAALTLIGKRFRSAKLLTHETATREAFLTKASTARIIHLFTHAVADSTDQEPKLYFADSTLKLSDLSDGALPNAELIALAACKTGIGANQRGEGVFSLARGFAALGVPSVLTTLWSVENEATYRLTDLFYAYLDQGLPKDIALQRAKQDWLKTAERTGQLPNYWAGLIIVGDAEPIVTNYIGLWVVLPILLLISVGWWLWHKRKQQSQAYTAEITSS